MTECGREFTRIYETRAWGYGSGGGSDAHAMTKYIDLVETAIVQLKPRVVLDIGCGDGRIAAAVRWGDARYIGVDCVASVVEDRKAQRVDARLLDVTTDELPTADLVLIKEVTQHLSNEMIHAVIKKLWAFPAVLHTSAVAGKVNQDIPTGHTRTVNLALHPFELDAETLCAFSAGTTKYFTQLWRPSC